MRRLIVKAIDTVFRFGIRAGLGLRIPASRIRQHDIWTIRNEVCERIRESVQTTSALMNELALLDKEIVEQHAATTRLEKTRDGLRMPSPTQPIGDI